MMETFFRVLREKSYRNSSFSDASHRVAFIIHH